MNNILDIFSGFCLCEIQQQLAKVVPPNRKNTTPKKKQVRKFKTYDFTQEGRALKNKLAAFIAKVSDESEVSPSSLFVKGRKKAQACRIRSVSKRRWNYTGVTRNSVNFQTLIVIRGKKTYVGSFRVELHAATTFDFYSMMLHGERAITNFDWNAQHVMAMVDVFEANNGVFDPIAFHSKFPELKFK